MCLLICFHSWTCSCWSLCLFLVVCIVWIASLMFGSSSVLFCSLLYSSCFGACTWKQCNYQLHVHWYAMVIFRFIQRFRTRSPQSFCWNCQYDHNQWPHVQPASQVSFALILLLASHYTLAIAFSVPSQRVNAVEVSGLGLGVSSVCSVYIDRHLMQSYVYGVYHA